MEIITKFDVIEQVDEPILLTELQAMEAFDLFVQGYTVNKVAHTLVDGTFLEKGKLQSLYVKLAMINDMIKRIVLGQAKVDYEEGHYEVDQETGEQIWVIDQPDMYADSPISLVELKQTALEVISNDETVSVSIFQGTIYELIDGLYYVIEEIVKHSNQTNDATFDWWKQKVIENASS